MTEFTDAVDHLETTYGKDMYLGRLVWYTVSETTECSYEDFHKATIANFFMLPDRQPTPPGFPKPTDVFKRACTAAQRKNVETGIADTKYNYMVRATGHDDNFVWRTIVREAVDLAGHTLGYEELTKVSFNRASESLKFNNITEVDDENVNEIVESITSYFHHEKTLITAYAVREFTRKYLERTLHATKVRPSGGVYFVNERDGAAVEALDKTLNGVQGASFHYLPLIDDTKQREMLRIAFEDESIGEIDALLGEMAALIKSEKKITPERFASFKVHYDTLKEKAVDYSELLDNKLDKTHNRLDVMNKVLLKLIGSVK